MLCVINTIHLWFKAKKKKRKEPTEVFTVLGHSIKHINEAKAKKYKNKSLAFLNVESSEDLCLSWISVYSLPEWPLGELQQVLKLRSCSQFSFFTRKHLLIPYC